MNGVDKAKKIKKLLSDPEALADEFVDSQFMQDTSTLLAEERVLLLEDVDRLGGAADVEVELDRPDADAHAQQIRATLKAIIRGDLPAHWVRTYAPVDNADEAAAFAALDESEWRGVREDWADRYRDRGIDGDVEELASQHIQARYGVGRAEFEDLVVEWDQTRLNQTLRRLLMGPVLEARRGVTRVVDELESDASGSGE